MRNCNCEHWGICPTCQPERFDADGKMKPVGPAGCPEAAGLHQARLRPALSRAPQDHDCSAQVATAAELRRLHAECEHRMQAINGLTRLANGYHDDLMTLRTAIKKLHAAKGRYHTQIAACDLYDLLGLKNERPTK